MAKQNERVPKRTPDEVAAMAPEEKLRVLKYLENEISRTEGVLKDQKAAAKDYIDEMREQQKEILDPISPIEVEGSVSGQSREE